MIQIYSNISDNCNSHILFYLTPKPQSQPQTPLNYRKTIKRPAIDILILWSLISHSLASRLDNKFKVKSLLYSSREFSILSIMFVIVYNYDISISCYLKAIES